MVYVLSYVDMSKAWANSLSLSLKYTLPSLGWWCIVCFDKFADTTKYAKFPVDFTSKQNQNSDEFNSIWESTNLSQIILSIFWWFCVHLFLHSKPFQQGNNNNLWLLWDSPEKTTLVENFNTSQDLVLTFLNIALRKRLHQYLFLSISVTVGMHSCQENRWRCRVRLSKFIFPNAKDNNKQENKK